MRDLGSVWRGLLAMKWPYVKPKPRWAINCKRCHWGFWLHYWTPVWHQGRGPYLTVGLGIVAVYRGY